MAIPEESRPGMGIHDRVPLEKLLRNGFALVQSWNRGKEIEGADVFALKHSAAAHNVAISRVSGSVKTPADFVRFLDDGDVLAWDVSVANQEGRGREGSDSASNQVDCRVIVGEIVRHGATILSLDDNLRIAI